MADKRSGPIHIRPTLKSDPIKSQDSLMIIHRHWFGWLGLFVPGLLILLVFGILRLSLPEVDWLSGSSLTGLTILVALVMILFYALTAVIYFSNRLILTDTGIEQTMRTGFFFWKKSHLGLANIEDVTVVQHGFFANSLNFGTLAIETAGEQNNFLFRWCPQPNRCAKIIVDTRDDYLEDQPDIIDKVN